MQETARQSRDRRGPERGGPEQPCCTDRDGNGISPFPQAVVSGDAFEHRPSERGHCVQDFSAELDLRDLPGEAAGFESLVLRRSGIFFLLVFALLAQSAWGQRIGPLVLDNQQRSKASAVERTAAVARISFEKGAGSSYCSGTLLNNRRQDLTPYFLTAAHCVGTEEEPRSTTASWFYQTQTCNGELPDFQSVPYTEGARLLSTAGFRELGDPEGDMTLLRQLPD